MKNIRRQLYKNLYITLTKQKKFGFFLIHSCIYYLYLINLYQQMSYNQEEQRDDEGFCLQEDEEVEVQQHPIHFLSEHKTYHLKNSYNYHSSLSREPQIRIKLISTSSNNCRLEQKIKAKSLLKNQESFRVSMKDPFGSTNLSQFKEKLIIYKKKIITRDAIQFDTEEDYLDELKYNIKKEGKKIVLEQPKFKTTHHYINSITSQIREKSFLKSKFNSDLRKKIQKFKQEEFKYEFDENGVAFKNKFQSSNLTLANIVNEKEYDLYIRIDTNTKGHNNWYSFKVLTNSNKTLKLNICNFRRQFSLYSKGLKPFVMNSQTKKWEQIGQNVVYYEKIINQIKNYCLSFTIEFKQGIEYHLSLLPTYTYTEMLQQIELLQKSKKIQIQNLGSSLSGLGIPLITIQNKLSETLEKDKNVILISSRIHPGESVGSFIVKGMIQKLLQKKNQLKQLLDTTIIKIIPMLNPDGVVFGNFRTSLLGVDLNRCFQKDDEILFPEVVILKKYGAYLKAKYKQKFLFFFDLHGHSTKKNIFVYGPEYSITSNEYYQSRIIPKILDMTCKHFRYAASSFRLQQYKYNTARGYFCRQLKVMAYTLQSSYGLYDEGKEVKLLNVDDWIECGAKIVESFGEFLTMDRYSKLDLSHFKNKQEKQKFKLLKHFKSSIDKQARYPQEKIKQVNSDSEGEDQDYTKSQRMKIEKKIYMISLQGNSYLPKVPEKQQVLYPMGTPSLFQTSRYDLKFKVAQPRKGYTLKFNGQKRQKFMKQLQKLELIQPQARNIKVSQSN